MYARKRYRWWWIVLRIRWNGTCNWNGTNTRKQLHYYSIILRLLGKFFPILEDVTHSDSIWNKWFYSTLDTFNWRKEDEFNCKQCLFNSDFSDMDPTYSPESADSQEISQVKEAAMSDKMKDSVSQVRMRWK